MSVSRLHGGTSLDNMASYALELPSSETQSRTRESSPYFQVQLELHIMDGGKLIAPQWGRIDSRATDNFIDVKATRALQIPLFSKPTSSIIETIDGFLLSLRPVTQA